MREVVKLAADLGVTENEVFFRDVKNTEIKFENDNLKNIASTQNSGIGIRGIYNNKLGVCSYTHESDSKNSIERLKESSKFSEPKEYEFSKPSFYNNPVIYDANTENIDVNRLVREGSLIIDKIKQYDKNTITSVTFENEIETIKISNSFGVEGQYIKSSFVAYVTGQIIDGTNFSDVDTYKYGIDKNYDLDLLVNTFIAKMKIARANAKFQSGPTKIIFTPKAFGNIMTTISQGVNGSTIEKGISPLCGRIGDAIFDDRFSMVDDASLDYHLGSAPFDDEGVPTKKNIIIENGVLKSYIHSLKTAAKTGFEPTGNGNRGSYSSLPSPSFNNMLIVPGRMNFEEMLDIMNEGIIIDEILGLEMNNILNGDFGGNIQLGYKVEKGKIIGRIKNAVFNSNIYSILKNNLIGISNLEYNDPLIYNVFSPKKQPCVMFDNINITIK